MKTKEEMEQSRLIVHNNFIKIGENGIWHQFTHIQAPNLASVYTIWVDSNIFLITWSTKMKYKNGGAFINIGYTHNDLITFAPRREFKLKDGFKYGHSAGITI